MNITDNLKQELISQFKSEKKLLQSIQNKEYSKFESLNSNQLFKVFDLKQQNIFSETNSKKHLTKIFDMIKQNFYNSKTNNYVNVLLNPTNNLKEYEKRKLALKNSKKINFENENSIKKIIKDIKNLNTKIVFNNRIYTFEKHIADIIYDNYKINVSQISKEEIEQMASFEDLSDIIIISDEDLYTEIPVFNLNKFQKLIKGNIIKTNSNQIIKLIELFNFTLKYRSEIIDSAKIINDIKIDINLDSNKLLSILKQNDKQTILDLTNKTLRLEEEVEIINKELKDIISKKQLSLQGDELLELLNSGSMEELQKKFQEDIKDIVNKKEKEFFEYYKSFNIIIDNLFSSISYPLKLDEEIKNEILNKINSKETEQEIEIFSKLGEFDFNEIKKLWNYAYYFDFYFGLSKFIKNYSLTYPQIKNEMCLIDCKNIYIKDAMPITYAIGSNQIKLKEEKVSILTGANSGGKTTLLEMFLQSQILTSIGLGISGESQSSISLQEEVIYLKKFTGTQGSGAFEQTIRNLIEIISSKTKKLLLIDEFEAITEPGAAAKILINFLQEITTQNTFCIGVSHLGLEIQEFLKEQNISNIRIDGISATGLDEKGNLITNHQPQFYQLGKSTPELILKRILQDEKFWNNKSNESKKLLEKIIN